MTAHDRRLAHASAHPRTRVAIPSWMAAWPRGVQPISAWASRRGVELLFRAPAESGFSWFRVVASLAPERAAGLEVRPIPGKTPEVSERLARAVEHHLSRSPAAREWLTKVREVVSSLASLRTFGGDRGGALDELLTCVASLADAGGRDVEPELLERIEQALAQAERQFGTAIAELEILLWLASGSYRHALDAWARRADEIEARRNSPRNRAALMCMGIVHAFLGDIAAAQACAIDLADRTRDAVDARHAGELLDWVGRPQLAVDQLLIAASDLNEDGGAFDGWRRLAGVSVAARRVEPLRRAATAMCELARTSEQRREAAAMQREAGDFAAAEDTLERLLREQADDAEGLVELAVSRLWRGEHRGAAALAHIRLARAPNDAAALRTLGVAEFFSRDLETSLRHLTEALSIDEHDEEARLWRARVLDMLGRYQEARADVVKVLIGDQVVWQLLRALIEEHATPGYRTELDTWFIIDQNIRQLLGDEAPKDTRATHEVAVAAIEAALDRLSGNYSTRLTTPTPDGSLRWLDGVESPRHRAERLQFELTRRPIDEVIAEFDALAAAHPDVPFFTTYSAEYALWRGDYEQAFERFEQVWNATRTRWGYVGAGAAAMLLGRDERALQLWEEGKRWYTYLDAEATYCYRGELMLRRGELDAAQPDLELAVQARPERLGAWIDLALLHRARGHESPMRDAAARVEQLCPAFVHLIERELGSSGVVRSADVDVLARVLERLRERMRGNRSSVMYTLVDDDGKLRVIPVGTLQAWRVRARRALGLLEAELLGEVATLEG